MARHTIKVTPDKLASFTVYLDRQIAAAEMGRNSRIERYNEIDSLLRADKSVSLDTGDDIRYVTPVTQMRVDVISARIYEAIFSIRPVAKITPVTGADPLTGLDWKATNRECTDWFDWAARRPNQLDCEATTRKCIGDFSRYGLACWKVINDSTKIKSGLLTSEGVWESDQSSRTIYEGPKWCYVSPRDLLWPEGYGGDPNTIPWIGIRYRRSLSWLTYHANNKDYDPAVVDYIRQEAEETSSTDMSNTDMPIGAPVIGYDIDEIWVRYDIDGDGIEEDLLIDRHVSTGKILRLVYNTYRVRPIYVARLRYRSSTSFDSMGIPDILRPVQKQIDELHNLAISAGKVATKSVRLIRTGSALSRTLIDEGVEITPGFEAVTDDPGRDMLVLPLGQPGPAIQALQLIEYNMRYAQELVGVGPSASGDVSQTRRAPAYGVQAVLNEGSTFTRDASRIFAVPFTEAIIGTFEIIRQSGGANGRMYQILGQDGIWVEKLLTLPDNLPDTWAVNITIADPDNDPSTTVQRNMILAQFMLSWLQQVGMAVQAIGSLEVPDSVKLGLGQLAVVSEEIVQRVIEGAKEMQDISTILPHLKQLFPQLMQMAQIEQQQQAQMAAKQAAATLAVGGPHALLGVERPEPTGAAR